MTAADGADGKRILVFAESTICWNALLPVVMGLRQRAGLQRAKIGVSRPADKDHVEWYFISAASARLFRELYVPADDAMVPSWDIFVVSMKSPFVGLAPAQHVVCVHHGMGFGNHADSCRFTPQARSIAASARQRRTILPSRPANGHHLGVSSPPARRATIAWRRSWPQLRMCANR